MKRIVSQTFAAGLCLAIAVVAVAAAETNAPATKPADKLAELFGDPVIAQGKGVTVKRSELDAAVMGIKASNLARGQQFTAEQNLLLERQVLDRLIQIQLLLQKASEADRAKGKATTDERYDQILKRAGSEENLARQLKSVGLTAEELRRKMTDESTAENVVLRELKAEPTDADVQKYYEGFPARFEQPEQVRAAHILLGTLDPETRQPLSEEKKQAKRKRADDLLKRARAGEDFAKLAREFSEDPGSRDKSGEYTFPRGQMVPEFETTAFSQATNQISDIVTTQFGYHIIKTLEKLPARKLTLQETLPDGMKVSDRVKATLRTQQLEKVLPDYIEKLTAEASVEIKDEKMKQAGETMKQLNAEARKNAAGLDKTELDKKATETKK